MEGVLLMKWKGLRLVMLPMWRGKSRLLEMPVWQEELGCLGGLRD